MMLIDAVKSECLTARKDRANGKPKANLLITLIGELEGKAKREQSEVTDELVISTCKKFISNNSETIKQLGDNDVSALVYENEVLSVFLPSQMTPAEIQEAITLSGMTNIGQIMGYMKLNHAGQFDGAVASKIARTVQLAN